MEKIDNYSTENPEKRNLRPWIVGIFILIVLVVGVGIYFLTSGDSGSVMNLEDDRFDKENPQTQTGNAPSTVESSGTPIVPPALPS